MSVKIAISGDLGSGKSTIGRLFENRMGFKFHSGGSIFRSLATKYNMTPAEFSKYSEIHPEVDEEIDGDLTRQLSIIESNFESLVSQISILFDKSDRTLVEKLNQEFNQMSNMTKELLIEKLDSYKAKIEKTFDTLNEKTIEQ